MTAIRTSQQNAFEGTLTAEMGPNDTTATVDGIGTLTSPCYLVIEMDSDTQREYIYFDGSFTGTTFTTTNIANRYLAGSAAGSNLTHPIGTKIRTYVGQQHHDDLHDRIDGLSHDDLDNLAADDHPQYSRADGTRAFTGTVAGVTPSAGADLTTKTYVDGQISGSIPPGIISAYGAASAPAGYLLCDGAEVSRSTFAALFTVIASIYGDGNGTTTFDLPDLRQRFPLGLANSGTGSSLGDTGGDIDHVHSVSDHVHTMPTHNHGMPNHSHTMPTHSHVNPQTGIGSGSDAGTSQNVSRYNYTTAGNKATHDHTIGSTLTTDPGDTNNASGSTNANGSADTQSDGAGDTGAENPPFLSVQYIIKT